MAKQEQNFKGELLRIIGISEDSLSLAQSIEIVNLMHRFCGSQKIETRLKDKNEIPLFEGDVLFNEDEMVFDVITWNNEFQYHLKNNYSNSQDEFSDWAKAYSIDIKDINQWEPPSGR